MKTILTIICAFILQSMYSQQDSQYTQYMYNTPLINPAYAGSRETITAFLLHRNQWVGLDGAPVTNNFSINMPVGDSNFGVGLNFVNDEIGPVAENQISVDLAYFIQISENCENPAELETETAFFADENARMVSSTQPTTLPSN